MLGTLSLVSQVRQLLRVSVAKNSVNTSARAVSQKKMKFYFLNETETLSSALSPELESLCSPNELVYCTKSHPLDTFLKVESPSEKTVRTALLSIKDKIRTARRSVHQP